MYFTCTFDCLLFINVEEKANILNEFFIAQCREIKTGSTIPTSIPQFPSPLSSLDRSREKVLRIIRSLETKKAHGCDQISVAMIKMSDKSIIDPLCRIFETCLGTGIYPSQWKKASIIPVHKKCCKQNKKNYRPISLLPIFGKIFEKALSDASVLMALYHLINQGFVPVIQQSISFC